MAVPKKKTSKSRRNMRRSHDALKPIHLAIDKETGEYKLPHHISLIDGYYKGRQVINIKGINKKDTENSETDNN